MDCRYDCFSLFGKVFEEKDDLEGSGWVETGCGLIKEDDARICDKLHSNRCAFAFSTTNALDESVAHFNVCAAGKT